jgi:hypothetical protein
MFIVIYWCYYTAKMKPCGKKVNLVTSHSSYIWNKHIKHIKGYTFLSWAGFHPKRWIQSLALQTIRKYTT